MDWQFDTQEPVDLVVELGKGAVSTKATETSRSTVEILGPRADEFTVELRGRQLAVLAPRHHRGFFSGENGHEVRVVVPVGSGLDTRTGSASVQAAGSYGAVRAKTGSGDVAVEAAEGTVVIDSGSGDIRCDAVGADLRVKSGSGDVEIGDVHGTAAISTGSGDITMGLASASTVAKTGSGDVRIQRAAADVNATTGSGAVVVAHASRGSIRGKTGSGDVRVGIPTGTPVWTDLSSATGRVVSDLSAVGKPADGQDHVELRLRTGTGDIVLSQV